MRLLILFLAGIAFCINTAQAKISFKAKNFIHDQTTEEIHAVGGVLMGTEKGSLYADEVWIHTKTDQARGQGNIILEDTQFRIEAEKFNYNFKAQTGTFENFLLTSRSIQVKGEKLEQLDKKHFYITQGTYSPCKGYCKDWEVGGSTIDLTIDGYVWVTHALVQANSVPIFYSPLAVFPAKTQRESGFLFPYFSYLTTVGPIISTPYFINVFPHTDLTLTPHFYLQRGYGLNLEHRYMLSPTWKGTSYLDTVYETDGKQTLYGIKTDNMAYFESTGVSVSLKGMSGSEERYFNEYIKNIGDQGLSGISQTLGMHYGPQWLDASARVEYVQDILPRQRFITNPNYFVLPWIQFQSKLWNPLPWLGFSSEASIFNTHRFSGGEYDNIPPSKNFVFSGDQLTSANDDISVFDDDDIVVGLTRYELKPRLVTAASIGEAFRWDSEVVFPYRYYVLPGEGAVQKYATFAYPQLSDKFSISFDQVFYTSEISGIRHVFTPAIVHIYRPQILKTGYKEFFISPNFGLDTTDLTTSSHAIGLSLSNTLTEKIKETYKTLMTFSVAWNVFTTFGIILEPKQKVETIGPVNTSIAAHFEKLSMYLTSSTQIANNFITTLSSTTNYSPISWLAFSLTAEASTTTLTGTQTGGQVTLSKIMKILTISTGLNYSFATNDIQTQTSSLTLTPESSCWQFTLIVQKSLKDDGFSFFPYFSLNFGEYFGGGYHAIQHDALGTALTETPATVN